VFNTDQKIQAPTTNSNPYGLMATPCMLNDQDRKTRVAFAAIVPREAADPELTDEQAAARGLVEHIEATNGPEGLDRLIAALPDVIDQSLKTTIPHRYTPELAAQMANRMIANLRRARTGIACPDGITWCEGKAANHADDDEHRHEGPEYSLSGPYVQGAWTNSLVGFQIAQWPDGEPHLVFQSDGAWPDLDMPQVDELIADAVPWLTALIATRRRIAIELKPGRTPFTDSEDKQTASAAFDLATRAMDVALAKTEDRAGTLRALRNFLDQA
jgi:hypothetical protein